MNKDPRIYIAHIFESIELIEKYTEGISEEDFTKDTETQDAVMRRIEIIGEASKCLLDEFKNQYPAIPWKNITGMRDKLIHEYFGVDIALVWAVVKKDIPKLKDSLRKVG